MKKLLISIPVEVAGSISIELARFLMTAGSISDDVQVAVSIVPGNPVASNRNKMVKQFLSTDFDWLLMVDSDMAPSHQDVQRLIECAKMDGIDVVSGVADRMTNGGPMPVVYKFDDDWGVTLHKEILDRNWEDGPFRLERGGCGAACLLVKREPMELFRDQGVVWFKDTLCEDPTDAAFGDLVISEDSHFWKQCVLLGVKGWVDMGSYWGHIKPTDLKRHATLIQSARKN